MTVKCQTCSGEVEWNTDLVLTMNPPQYRGTCADCGKTSMEECFRIDHEDYPARRLFEIDHAMGKLGWMLEDFKHDLLINDEVEMDRMHLHNV